MNPASSQIPTEKLDLSVIIATRNRSAILWETLNSLKHLDTRGLRWELIVVDNGSTDDTAQILEQARSRLPLAVFHEPRLGQNYARNKGLENARGELLIFSDDDILFPANWLQEYLETSRRWPECGIFGGPIEPVFPEGVPVWIREHPQAGFVFGRFNPNRSEGPFDNRTTPFGGNYAIRASILRGLQFDNTIGPRMGKNFVMGSETELLRRLLSQGVRVCYVPGAGVRHRIQENQTRLQWLLWRIFRAGRSEIRLSPDKDTNSPRLFGAPRHLWRKLAEAWLRYALGWLRGGRVRFETGLDLYRIRGWIYEYRLISRQAAMDEQERRN